MIPTEQDDFPITSGYKAPQPKTMQELENLDKNDESLRKWKDSLLKKGITKHDNQDPRNVIINTMALEVDGKSDLVIDLSAIESTTKNIIIKEGIDYRLKISFSIQNDVVSGLKYLQIVKRKGITVDKMQEMIGSYAPNQNYLKKFAVESAPSGFLARGVYNVQSKFVDDDENCFLNFNWSFQIKKDWEE